MCESIYTLKSTTTKNCGLLDRRGTTDAQYSDSPFLPVSFQILPSGDGRLLENLVWLKGETEEENSAAIEYLQSVGQSIGHWEYKDYDSPYFKGFPI